MSQLIKLSSSNVNGKELETVDARELHSFLEIGKVFAAWIQDRIEQYGFVENLDFVVFSESGNNPRGGRPAKEYAITLDMAKELSMVERNAKGKQARQYFIECEKNFRQQQSFKIPQTLSEALRLAADQSEQIEAQKLLLAEQASKVEFHDQIASAINGQTVQEVAKVLGTGQKRLFAWLRNNNFLMSNNQPYQDNLDSGHCRLVEKRYLSRGEVVTYTQTLITGKGLSYIQKRIDK